MEDFPASKLHIVLFPLMAQGHTIPMLDLGRLLLSRGASITFFTTAENHPFISESLPDNPQVSIIDLPFPKNIVSEIPSGVENTEKLSSFSLFFPFASATKLMQTHFEQALQTLPQVHCIISDGILYWTLQSALKFGIPRLSFYGTSLYFSTVCPIVRRHGLTSLHESADEPFTLPTFPWIKLTRNDLVPPINAGEPEGPFRDWVIETDATTSNSFGLIVNSFYELESRFVDYWNRECRPKAWCIGPMCLAQSPKIKGLQHQEQNNKYWEEWLDQKLAQGCRVLYVASGTHVHISPEQLQEIAVGLEESKVNFLWVVRENAEIIDELQERVRERALMVREWTNQRQILEHEAVQGFLSNCGWNSILESICAKVPILAWPMVADQHLNARVVVEEIKIGLRVETVNGSVRGFVKGEGLKKGIIELMEGERGKELRRKVEEVGDAAKKAVEEGGSSRNALNELISELQSLN